MVTTTMGDAQAALEAIVAASNDTEALAVAIREAAFLDATPGEPRQKLRAARTKLRKIKADEAAKKLLLASKNAADRSPHAKESYSAAEFDALSEKYAALNWRIVSKPGGATVKPDEFYTLYHMQAAQGDNEGERPMWAEKGGLDFEGRARWDAWTERKGMKPPRAKMLFVQNYYEFTPRAMYTDGR